MLFIAVPCGILGPVSWFSTVLLGHVELVHQRRQGGDYQRLVENGRKRADHQGDDHGSGVGRGGAVGVGGVVEPASAVAGEELRDAKY